MSEQTDLEIPAMVQKIGEEITEFVEAKVPFYCKHRKRLYWIEIDGSDYFSSIYFST